MQPGVGRLSRTPVLRHTSLLLAVKGLSGHGRMTDHPDTQLTHSLNLSQTWH